MPACLNIFIENRFHKNKPSFFSAGTTTITKRTFFTVLVDIDSFALRHIDQGDGTSLIKMHGSESYGRCLTSFIIYILLKQFSKTTLRPKQ